MTEISHPPRNRIAGPMILALSLQFFLVEQFVSMAWPFPYSRVKYFISDLGAVHCDQFTNGVVVATLPVCSPLHSYMNASFIVLGVAIGVGSVLTRPLFPAGRLTATAQVFFCITGLGAIVVGLVPNDVILPLHLLGAILFLFGASAGMLLLSCSRRFRDQFPASLVLFTLACGGLSLGATGLFASGITLGLGIGEIERVALYPIPLWFAIAGMYLLLGHQLRRH